MAQGHDPLLPRLQSLVEGAYAIEREIGRGGMATVYLARDLRHGRQVAIKLLQPELTTATTAERFLREIQITAKLQHPHILPLIDSGAHDGLVYYVMPHVEGESLRERLLWQRQCAIENAVAVARQVATALAYAHGQGVIHRDIKPENILLHDGRPMVMDFGIALAVSAAAGGRMTETGLSLGTPHYMSPEQATADKQITARSDVYSLASVLYEMLAGEPPHSGGSAQAIIMKIIAEPAQPVTELRSSVPANVAAALARALEKIPADRFASAKEFAAALTDRAFRDARTGHTDRVDAPDHAGDACARGARAKRVDAVVAQAAAGRRRGRRRRGDRDAGVRSQPRRRPRRRVRARSPPERGAVVPASIGVRPLDAIGDDSVTGTASAGIAEEISAQLSKIRQLRVISCTTMEAVDSKGWTSRQAADSLGVRFLLEGSVQRSGQEIGVTLQLIDAASDAHVWSETFRQPFQDILMTRQAIARKVVEALAGEVRGLALANADVESRVAEAIQARAHAADLANPVSEERLAGAIASYEHAMELDPNYAAAAAELSDALRYYVTLGFRARRDPFEALRQSLRWAETAVRLDPNLAQAYARGARRGSAPVSGPTWRWRTSNAR
ncbi:MAG: serine/threonine-protein kinase [Gemmatimonadales bacterium]